MILNDRVWNKVDYGRVQIASAGRGFKCDDTEYWPDQYKWLHADTTGATDTVKTVTLDERGIGTGANMDLDDQLRPTERFPRCIMANPLPFACCMVNAVGLANKGARAHWDMNFWQKFENPWFKSEMALGETLSERMRQWEAMDRITDEYAGECKAPFALKRNISCPNTEHSNGSLFDKAGIAEIGLVLDQGAEHGRAQIVKVSLGQINVEIGLAISELKHCDALMLSNTIPWYELPPWVRLLSFVTPFSPLRWRGIEQPGGYSGPYMRRPVNKIVRELRQAGCTKPIIVGGGITLPKHVNDARDAGADAIAVATLLRLRWWRMQDIVQRANSLTWRK